MYNSQLRCIYIHYRSVKIVSCDITATCIYFPAVRWDIYIAVSFQNAKGDRPVHLNNQLLVLLSPWVMKMPVIRSFLILFLLVEASWSTGLPQETTFWVAPTMAACRNKPNCNTLAGYQKSNATIFSTSDATWTFLWGTHQMLPTPIVVSGAQNVTWTGGPGCTPRHCQILQPLYTGMMNKSSLCSYVVFEDCQGVLITELGFASADAKEWYPKPCDNLKLDRVEDASLHSVMLSGRYGLGVFNATGQYEIANSVFEKNADYIKLDSCPRQHKNCTFWLNLTNITLISSRGIHLTVSDHANREYSSISILVDNCSFAGPFGQKQLIFKIWSYPSDFFAITVRNSIFRDHVQSLTLYSVLMVQNWSLVGAPSYRPRIHLDGISVSNSYHGVWFNLGYKFDDNNSCDVQYPEIIISNSTFFENRNHRTDAAIAMIYATLQPNNAMMHYEQCRVLHSFPASNPATLLKIQDSKFCSNQFSTAIYIEGFYWHRAAFEGGNEIANNIGIGVELNDTLLEVHGYNEIHNNVGGLLMTSDSHLLLANGSILNVTHNSADFGGGIHISYSGRNTASYEDFLHCYVYKTTCPGWCFFQFVAEDGHLLTQDQFNGFHASLNLVHNQGFKDGDEIYNGHLQSCSLMVKDRVVGATTDTLLKVLPLSALAEAALDSLPHYICLCNNSNPLDDSLWRCKGSHSLTIYPGDKVHLLVTILKDFNRSSLATIFVNDGQYRNELEVNPCTCTNVYTLQCSEAGKQGPLQLYTTAPGQGSDYSLTKVVTFKQLDCPLGMRNTSTSCTCNSVLAQHGFDCSGHQYKSARPYTWIGMDNGRLVFSHRCIFQLCNSALANGIPPANLSSSSQCSSEFQREGLLCTKCPENQQPEYISFKCRECPYEWIALLFILLFGGLFVVVFLFLFNLTILQGTINGFILYCSVMIHTDSADFFSLYAWKPLYIVFRLLSLGFGHGLCFFDEFSKSLLHFSFPVYLFILVAVIIICAHKFNFRIFRVTFIARRAVPVLTTLMIMTFVRLAEAVFLALQYNNIYDAITGEKHTVFLFDNTLSYFGGKHLVLGLTAIIFTIIYLIPLMTVTLFGDLLRRCSRSIWLSHFIDVFHGSYRYPFGFWTGVRLLARLVLMVVSLSIETHSPGRALGLFVVILCLCLFQLYFKPFRTLEDHLATSQYSPSSCRLFSGHSRLETLLTKLQPATLDFLYLLNAVVTSATIMFNSASGVNPTALTIVANLSLSVALIQFLAIMCYHTYRFLPLPKPVRMCLKACYKCFSKGRRKNDQQSSEACGLAPTFDDTAAHAEPIMSIKLHQPVSGGHGNGYDSDESSSVSSDDSSDDKMESTQSDMTTDVTDISTELTVSLLLH